MCLMCRATEKDPRQGSPVSAEQEKIWRKRPKRPSDCRLQEAPAGNKRLEKKALIGPQLLWWRQPMSLHT